MPLELVVYVQAKPVSIIEIGRTRLLTGASPDFLSVAFKHVNRKNYYII